MIELDVGNFLRRNHNRSSLSEALMIQGIDNIGVYTTDVARTVAFYRGRWHSIKDWASRSGTEMTVA
jgi:hypothetical protein